MLTITVPATEQWDELHQEFIYVKETTLQLEHSLVSISKWESKWHKAFLVKAEKTNEEAVDYIRCMTLNKNVDPSVYRCLTRQNLADIDAYIEDPMTATYFSEGDNSTGNKETVTSELVYYWMIALTIPIEFEKWHFNRLLTLIRVCNIKNQPPKKMGRQELISRNAALNSARRKKFNSKG